MDQPVYGVDGPAYIVTTLLTE